MGGHPCVSLSVKQTWQLRSDSMFQRCPFPLFFKGRTVKDGIPGHPVMPSILMHKPQCSHH